MKQHCKTYRTGHSLRSVSLVLALALAITPAAKGEGSSDSVVALTAILTSIGAAVPPIVNANTQAKANTDIAKTTANATIKQAEIQQDSFYASLNASVKMGAQQQKSLLKLADIQQKADKDRLQMQIEALRAERQAIQAQAEVDSQRRYRERMAELALQKRILDENAALQRQALQASFVAQGLSDGVSVGATAGTLNVASAGAGVTASNSALAQAFGRSSTNSVTLAPQAMPFSRNSLINSQVVPRALSDRETVSREMKRALQVTQRGLASTRSVRNRTVSLKPAAVPAVSNPSFGSHLAAESRSRGVVRNSPAPVRAAHAYRAPPGQVSRGAHGARSSRPLSQ